MDIKRFYRDLDSSYLRLKELRENIPLHYDKTIIDADLGILSVYRGIFKHVVSDDLSEVVKIAGNAMESARAKCDAWVDRQDYVVEAYPFDIRKYEVEEIKVAKGEIGVHGLEIEEEKTEELPKKSISERLNEIGLPPMKEDAELEAQIKLEEYIKRRIGNPKAA